MVWAIGDISKSSIDEGIEADSRECGLRSERKEKMRWSKSHQGTSGFASTFLAHISHH